MHITYIITINLVIVYYTVYTMVLISSSLAGLIIYLFHFNLTLKQFNMTLKINFATDCRGMPRMTARGRHRCHCLIIAIILFVGYYTVYTSYDNYYSDIIPSSDIGNAKFSPTQGSFPDISLCTIVWC